MRHISVPQYDNLSLKRIATFLNSGREHVFEYMPDSVEINKVSKEWICCICATVLEDEFSEWVRHQIQARNELVATKKNLFIAMDQEIADVFRASTKVSRTYSRTLPSFSSLFPYSLERHFGQHDASRQQAEKDPKTDSEGQGR